MTSRVECGLVSFTCNCRTRELREAEGEGDRIRATEGSGAQNGEERSDDKRTGAKNEGEKKWWKVGSWCRVRKERLVGPWDLGLGAWVGKA
jgi:hypothetical protein